jgi:type IV pilus assembly protein PilA
MFVQFRGEAESTFRARGISMTLFCAGCGNSLTADDKFCRRCGREIASASAMTSSPAAPSAPAQTSGKAIVSLICGLFFFFFPISIVAIVFGHLSLSEIRKSAGRLEGDGLAIAGLVLGYAGLAVLPVLIIAAIAIPNLLRARISANEAWAVSSVRTVISAEGSYATDHPGQGYTCSLSELAETKFVDVSLVGGQKSGYDFELTGCSAGANGGPKVKYQVVAYPTSVNQTGVRAFCTDESAVIRMDPSGSPRKCMETGKPL